MNSFPELATLRDLASKDVFVRIPATPEAPRQLWNRLVHARHLLRYVGRAAQLIEVRFHTLDDATNEDAMSRQQRTSVYLRQHHRLTAAEMRSAARFKGALAEQLLYAVAHAQIVGAAA